MKLINYTCLRYALCSVKQNKTKKMTKLVFGLHLALRPSGVYARSWRRAVKKERNKPGVEELNCSQSGGAERKVLD